MQDSSSTQVPPLRDVVLLGGGHSHVQVLKALGMKPQPGLRLTLISQDMASPYSGMLPGCISGVYSVDDIHIQLAPLCQFAKARFIKAEVCGLDLQAQQIQLRDRPGIRFDVLSINTGAVPLAPYDGAITVKPISRFLPQWQALRERMLPGQRLVVVGGGAGGVELAMSARRVLGADIDIHLLGGELLPGHAEKAKDLIQRRFRELNIAWLEDRAVAHAADRLQLDDGSHLKADHVLWVTQVQAPDWLGSSGLATDESGFVRVNEYLQSVSHPAVFAAGDVAHLVGQQRAKSGVYAVRAGPYLTHNLRAAMQDKPLRRYRAQTKHLALIGDGHGQALASRDGFVAQGKFWWWLKDRIDRRFMRKFKELPAMASATPKLAPSLAADLPDQDMRCGGCGAKIAADPLRRVLARLPDQASARVELGIGDDAALVNNSGPAALLTVDGFRAMVDDPYIFGRVVAHHSLNDIFAMAATPTAALVFASVPLMAQAMMEEDLYQVLAGLTAVLNQHDVPLVGGHSAEGAELSVGLTVMGEPSGKALEKGGAQLGQHLLLSKPVGTGVILAAAMQGRAAAASIEDVLAGMDQSNLKAVDCFVAAGASAMTDITGFGLIGHLGEMLRASGAGAHMQLQDVLSYGGADALIAELQSSLQSANELALQDFELRSGLSFADPRLRLLADPQTSGGLLAAVPADAAVSCLAALRKAGYKACDIGVIVEPETWIIS